MEAEDHIFPSASWVGGASGGGAGGDGGGIRAVVHQLVHYCTVAVVLMAVQEGERVHGRNKGAGCVLKEVLVLCWCCGAVKD